MKLSKTKSEIFAAAHKRAVKYVDFFGHTYSEAFAKSLRDAWTAARSYRVTPVGIKGSLLYREFYG